MAIQERIVARIPLLLGDYDSSKTYGIKNRVMLYGCIFESKEDNNATAPATKSGDVITFNTTKWNVIHDGREEYTGGSAYHKPSTGIPKTDLASDVQTSLGKADTAQQPATTLAGYGITDAYSATAGATLEAVVDSRLDTQDAAIALLNGSDVIVVADHTQVSSPNSQKIYREYGTDSYTDYMYQNNVWQPIATYTFPGIDSTPTANSNKLVTSGGIAAVLDIVFAGFAEVINAFENTAWISTGGSAFIESIRSTVFGSDIISLRAVYTQSNIVYDSDVTSLDDLKEDLVVYGVYVDREIQVNNYSLSGTLQAGTSVITVSYNGKSTTFNVTVSEYGTKTRYLYNEFIVEKGAPDYYTISGVGNCICLNNWQTSKNRKVMVLNYGTIPLKDKTQNVISPNVYTVKIPNGSTHVKMTFSGTNFGGCSGKVVKKIDGGHYLDSDYNLGYQNSSPYTWDISSFVSGQDYDDLYLMVYCKATNSNTFTLTNFELEFL